MLRVQQLMSPHDRKHPKVLKYTRHTKIHQAGDVRQIRPARLTHVQPVDAPFDTRCGSADKFSKPMTAAVEGSVQAIHPISSLDRFLDLKLRSEIELTTVFFFTEAVSLKASLLFYHCDKLEMLCFSGNHSETVLLSKW